MKRCKSLADRFRLIKIVQDAYDLEFYKRTRDPFRFRSHAECNDYKMVNREKAKRELAFFLQEKLKKCLNSSDVKEIVENVLVTHWWSGAEERTESTVCGAALGDEDTTPP